MIKLADKLFATKDPNKPLICEPSNNACVENLHYKIIEMASGQHEHQLLCKSQI